MDFMYQNDNTKNINNITTYTVIPNDKPVNPNDITAKLIDTPNELISLIPPMNHLNIKKPKMSPIQ